jgi:hypothetical protein
LAKEVTILLLPVPGRPFPTSGFRQGFVGAIARPVRLLAGDPMGLIGRIGIGSGGALATQFEILPLRGWWGMALHDIPSFLTISVFVIPMVILPAAAGLYCAIKSLSSGLKPSAVALLLQASVFLLLPMSNLVDPLGSSRFVIGLIAAMLNFGAELGWRRVLTYSQLWLLTLAFLPGDRLLPSG